MPVVPTLQSVGQSPQLLLTEAPRVIQSSAGATHSKAFQGHAGNLREQDGWVRGIKGQEDPSPPTGQKAQ